MLGPFKVNDKFAVTRRVTTLLMNCMFPMKITRFLERVPIPHAPVGAMRPRLTAAESPVLAPLGPLAPDVERRSQGNRRVGDRRSAEQPTTLDTRTAQGRRRNRGRRAEDRLDQAANTRISVRA
jgi:hypothetical protein